MDIYEPHTAEKNSAKICELMCPSGFMILEDFKLMKANKTAGIQKDVSDFAGTDGSV